MSKLAEEAREQLNQIKMFTLFRDHHQDKSCFHDAYNRLSNALDELERLEVKEKGIKPDKRDMGKPFLHKSWGYKQLYACPACGNCLLKRYANERQLNRYCWNCGAKLDWSDVHE